MFPLSLPRDQQKDAIQAGYKVIVRARVAFLTPSIVANKVLWRAYIMRSLRRGTVSRVSKY